MNQRNFPMNVNESNMDKEPNMLLREPNPYRRWFWIAVSATVVLALVSLALWWQLSRLNGESPRGSSSTGMTMPQSSAPNTSDSGQGSSPGETGASNAQETPLAPIQLTPQRMQSIGIVLGKVESKAVSSELRFTAM